MDQTFPAVGPSLLRLSQLGAGPQLLAAGLGILRGLLHFVGRRPSLCSGQVGPTVSWPQLFSSGGLSYYFEVRVGSQAFPAGLAISPGRSISPGRAKLLLQAVGHSGRRRDVLI